MAFNSFGPSSSGFSAPAASGFAAPATGGFGFGAPAATGFGAPAAAAAPPATGFGFGATTFGPAASTQQPAATGFGTGFGFGAPQQQPAATGFGLPAATTGGFGGFGGQPQPTQQQQQQAAQQQQQQQQQQAQFNAQYATSIEARVSAIKNSYSPASPDCRFQTVFYNKVEPNTIPQYVKPAIANARLWEAAVKNNPDPSALVPSLAVGFDDLRKRISEQDKAAAAFNATLASMSASLESMVHGHEASTASALVQLQRVHAQQSHRLLQLVNRVECGRSKEILPRLPQELEFDHKLQVLERKITQPQPMSLKIAELAAMVKLMEQKNDGSTMGQTAGGDAASSGASWLHPDDPAAQQLFNFLQTQRVALEHVTAMVKQDQRDLQTIQHVINQPHTNM
jgi:nuclear pore complex protein Nup54